MSKQVRIQTHYMNGIEKQPVLLFIGVDKERIEQNNLTISQQPKS